MDPALLSRIQFALTISFHYIYPPLSIGLGVILVLMEGLYLKTRIALFQQMTRFWARIFGLTFALGVATGVVMEFQFGTNWSNYSRFVGDVFGSALAAEGIFAFFLESGFLAILLFGWDKVGPRMHMFATVMVALGAHFSAIWIVVANSWMQTPAGFHIVQSALRSRAEIVDFWAMVFNPSAMIRLAHTVLGAWQAAAFFVLSVSAYYLLKRRHLEFAKASMRIGLVVAVFASFGSLVTGHESALVVSKYQPAKLAAMEGHIPASAPAGLSLFGWVNEAEQRFVGLSVPGMLSFMIHGDASKPVTGLSAFPPEDRPPVNPVFQAYHAMVGIGTALIGLSLLGAFLWWRGRLFETRWLLWAFVFAVLGPQMANQLGWFTAEVGRQPWIVYGLMRTADAVSPTVTAGQILASLAMFTLLYLALFMLFIYLLDQKIRHGPLADDLEVAYHQK
ncbi:MAG: cytochrome D ubiquinol oxidase subunit I [candidate division NC10 bacterium RBG_16_65_8]|nr:MAG: cytochrome D ubiquinol oxidase subunit I [candidate division NC10 bacterium RBG_16_65_8]